MSVISPSPAPAAIVMFAYKGSNAATILFLKTANASPTPTV